MEGGLRHRPKTLDEVFRLREREPECRLLAGGTDLCVQHRGRLGETPLLSLRRVAELRGVARSRPDLPGAADLLPGGECLRIGAGTTLSALLNETEIERGFPALRAALSAIGSRQIRNVATIGGNLCNASPAADGAPPLLVLDAAVEIASREGRRLLPLEEFFRGPGRTSLGAEEILAAVWVPLPFEDEVSVFLRKGRVKMDIAIASLALRCRRGAGTLSGLRLAAGAVGPTPLRLRRTEALLEGASLKDCGLVREPGGRPRAREDGLLARAMDEASKEIAPIDDLRASAWYRRRLVRVFLERAVAEVFAQ